jgi:tetratricopeptide (TPR) repeat protein
MFTALKDSINMVQCIQNIGVVYYHLKQYDKAEELLLDASKAAKKLDLNESIARIDLVLTDLYIVQNKFDDAEKTIAEGLTLSDIVKSKKTAFDLKYMSYLLDLKRKKYQPALAILTDLYKQDSTVAKQNTAAEITGVSERVKQEANLKENELLKQREAYDRIRFWSVLIMAALLLVLVGVLVNNVKRKKRTNSQLTSLNEEVSRQKDNLDRINHHLEEIIDERTKDLQVKNKKLSEYSSYLSHQIRGPIATLKGLMNLEKEGLVDQPECIRMMNKCVGEIDDKIIEMSDMLHDPGRSGF